MDQYPVRYAQSQRGLKIRNPIDYHHQYSLVNLILLFFVFSFLGWLWEVGIHLFNDGVFVNRGVLFGPWLPIYGSGGVGGILLLRRFLDRPVLTFFLFMAICAVVEYFTSWYLEWANGVRWWDYSNYFLNLNGRICLEGTVFFGVGGCLFLYFLAPMFDLLLNRIPRRLRVVSCAVLGTLFTADLVYSHFYPNTGEGITDYDQTGK